MVEDALATGLGGLDVHVDVIAPAMHWIGRLWEAGAVTVADEHLATAISQSMLAAIYPSLLKAPARTRPRVLLAAAEGELHVLGLRMVGDALEGEGYDVHFLGADVPIPALVDMARRTAPYAVVLSATIATGSAYLGTAVDRLAELPVPPRVVLGGQGVSASLRARDGVEVALTSRDVIAAIQRQPLAIVTQPPARGRADVGFPQGVGMVAGASGAALAAADIARAQARRAFDFERLALRDPLTDLHNRRAYEDHLRDLLDRSVPAVVLYLDVDNFKAINDTHGHPEADRALIDLGDVLLRHTRHGDLAARLGGDEFALVLQAIAPQDARVIAERIRAAVAAEIRPRITVSIGLAAAEGDSRTTAMAVDAALYESKRKGRDCVSLGPITS